MRYKKKDTGYPSQCPTTKSTIKMILTAILYAKLRYFAHLLNYITLNTQESYLLLA